MGNSIWRDILNVPGMGVAATATYSGFLGQALNTMPALTVIPLRMGEKDDETAWVPVGPL
jgi:hypothetical protein